MSEVAIKPPLGLKPRWIATQDRAQEVVNAMERYWDAGKSIPQEWHDELKELNKWLADHGYAPCVGFNANPLAIPK